MIDSKFGAVLNRIGALSSHDVYAAKNRIKSMCFSNFELRLATNVEYYQIILVMQITCERRISSSPFGQWGIEHFLKSNVE